MNVRMHTSERIVVVGGGVAVLSIAIRLAQAGLPVTVLEAGSLGQGASTRNQGWLHSGGWFAPENIEFARMCHESLQQTLRFCPECQERGHSSMMFLVSSSATDVKRWTQAWSQAGIPADELPLAEVEQRAPGLELSGMRRAFQLPDRAIRPEILLEHLAAAARHAGAEVRAGTPVARLIQMPHRVEGVVTDLGEELTARLVILAGNARGLGLIPGFGLNGPTAPSSHNVAPLKTHLLALRPELAPSPFCIVDADGFNHIPHSGTSVFGTNRWLSSERADDRQIVPYEIDRLWKQIGPFYRRLKRSACDAVEWAGTTLLALPAGRDPLTQVPWPVVIDHAGDTPGVQNVLSVFPGRATLWPQLAECTRDVVLKKLGSRTTSATQPPWAAFENRSAAECRNLQNVVLYHCQTCGSVERRGQGLQLPVCCDAAMLPAAEQTVRDTPRVQLEIIRRTAETSCQDSK